MDSFDHLKEVDLWRQQSYAMKSILEIMRNRIGDHDIYGLGEPSIQQLGKRRLMVELAGIDDASKAKEYIQRTADFELALVKNPKIFFTTIDEINNYLQDKIRGPISVQV